MIFDNDCRILHGGMKSEWALRQIRRTGAAEHHSGTLSRSTVAHSCRFAMLCRHCRAFGAPSADNGTQWHTAARRNRGERIERNACSDCGVHRLSLIHICVIVVDWGCCRCIERGFAPMGVGRYACFADFCVASHGPSGNGCDGCGRNGVFPGFPV